MTGPVLCTVRVRRIRPDGSLATGRAQLIPTPSVITHEDPVAATVSGNGVTISYTGAAGTGMLVVDDGAGTLPEGPWTYLVKETVDGQTVPPYYVEITSADVAAGIDLVPAPGDPVAGTVLPAVTQAELDAAVAAYHASGTWADLPDPTTVPPGALYFATDTDDWYGSPKLMYSDGTIWHGMDGFPIALPELVLNPNTGPPSTAVTATYGGGGLSAMADVVFVLRDGEGNVLEIFQAEDIVGVDDTTITFTAPAGATTLGDWEVDVYAAGDVLIISSMFSVTT